MPEAIGGWEDRSGRPSKHRGREWNLYGARLHDSIPWLTGHFCELCAFNCIFYYHLYLRPLFRLANCSPRALRWVKQTFQRCKTTKPGHKSSHLHDRELTRLPQRPNQIAPFCKLRFPTASLEFTHTTNARTAATEAAQLATGHRRFPAYILPVGTPLRRRHLKSGEPNSDELSHNSTAVLLSQRLTALYKSHERFAAGQVRRDTTSRGPKPKSFSPGFGQCFSI